MHTDEENVLLKKEKSEALTDVSLKQEKLDTPKKSESKLVTEDPKPRIVLTFRSDKSGTKNSNMKIVSTEEKHEDVQPRRSSRARHSKWESDDDNEVLVPPKKDKQVSENEDVSDNSQTSKRSSRRRSKDCTDILASAIARKEKYNETSMPAQRLSRRIKPTAKVLENEELRMGLESQNNMRLGITTDKNLDGVKTRRSAQNKNTEGTSTAKRKNNEKIIEQKRDKSVKKLKHLCELGLKAVEEDNTDDESESETRDTGDNEEGAEEEEEIDDDIEVISKLLEADEESGSTVSEVVSVYSEEVEEIRKPRQTRRLCSSNESEEDSDDDDQKAPRRRSKRLKNPNYSGHIWGRDSDDSNDMDYRPKKKKKRSYSDKNLSDDDQEDNMSVADGDEGSAPASPIESSKILVICECEEPSNIYASPEDLTGPVFCQAVETVNEARVGCSHSAAREGGALQPLLRAGPRAPYRLLCKQHAAQLKRHMCCAACGLFCTQGVFYQCDKGHLFHIDCAIPRQPSEPKMKDGCPHCGINSYGWTPVNSVCHKVNVQMHCTNKQIFLPDQREQCTQAFLGFSSLDPIKINPEPLIPEDLLPMPPIDLKQLCESTKDAEPDENAIQILYDAIVAGETVEQLVPKIIRGSRLNEAVEGGTVAHAAAARGHVAALWLLRPAGADLDALDTGARTPLMRALYALLDKEVAEESEIEHNEEPIIEDKQDDSTGIKEDIEVNQEETAVTKGEGEMTMEPMEATKEEELTKEDVEVTKIEAEVTKEDTEVTKEEMEVTKEEVEVSKEEEAIKEQECDKPKEEDLIKVIKFLVAAGCDVNIPGPEGMTSLHIAAQFGSEEVCSILLNSGGALVDSRDQGGWTPLVRAAENGHVEVVKLLLGAGAEAGVCDAAGNGAVHWCALAGRAPCLLLLLAAEPAALDSLNAHADTPLHIAAREGHYACVVMLLARGARLDLENSAGELPVEVCSGQCQAAIAVNMEMAVAIKGSLPRRRIISSDISNGREEHPIPCVNEVDDAVLPEDFVYVSENVMPTPIPIDNSIQTMQGCQCSGAACEEAASCACCALAVRRWYLAARLPAAFPYHDPPMLFECNATCACDRRRCGNHVVSMALRAGSLGAGARVCVFRTRARGWGLRARARLRRGALVAAYCGELLTADDADTRASDHYMFALDLKPDLLQQCSLQTQLCIDAHVYGSAARFINHSCRPNLAPVRVFTTHRDLRLPVVALFALRDVAPGDELTFDYGDKFWSVKSKWMKCECESPDCRYPTKTVDETESN